MELNENEVKNLKEAEREVKETPHKAAKELFEEVEEKEKKKLKIDKKTATKVAGGITALIVGGAVLTAVFNRTPTTVSNVDVDAVVKKVVKENQAQTQAIVNQLGKQIQALTEAVKKQQELLAQQTERQSVPAKEEEVEKIKQKFSKLQKRELLEEQKREFEMQKALLKQYLAELQRERQSPKVTLAVEVEKPQPHPVKKKTTLHRVYIPTGSVVEGETLHVIPAPVERGDLPLPPVLIKLTGDAYAANGFSVPLDDCFAVGKAQGDWNFIGGQELARAEVEVDELVCVLGNGKVVEKKVKGFVIDEETGLNGLTGKKFDVSGEQMLRYTAVNTLTGIFEGLADSARETINTKDGYTIEKITKPMKYALFSSLNKSWEKYAKFYEKRLSKINPVVLVPAHKKLQVVFLTGVDLGVTDKELEKWGI